MTKKQLEKFIRLRNTSEHQSNLQFQIDAEAAGFRISDLGDVKKMGDGYYAWVTPHGTLHEKYGKMSLGPTDASAA